MHKYYRNPETGEVYAYEADGSQDEYIKPSLSRMTDAEVQAHLNPPNPSLTREQIEALRLRAYADPLTGSDQLFSESMRMQIMGEEGHEDVRARAIARFEEIQAQYPWKAI